jgi:hypothetical protein
MLVLLPIGWLAASTIFGKRGLPQAGLPTVVRN